METINKFSTLTGRIIGVNSFGCYVQDDETGITVFYYGNGKIGDRVFLSVYRVDTEHNRVTCRLDSVLEYAA